MPAQLTFIDKHRHVGRLAVGGAAGVVAGVGLHGLLDLEPGLGDPGRQMVHAHNKSRKNKHA